MLDRDVIADAFVWLFYRTDWDAWSAIGTVGALWFAILAATRSARAEQSVTVGLLKYLEVQFFSIVKVLPDALPGDGALPRSFRGWLIMARERSTNLAILLGTIDRREFVQAGLIDEYTRWPAILNQFARRLQECLGVTLEMAEKPPPDIIRQAYSYELSILRENYRAIVARREALEHGRLVAGARRVIRRLRRQPSPGSYVPPAVHKHPTSATAPHPENTGDSV